MDFERGIEPQKAMGIGRKEYAFQMVNLLAKRLNLTTIRENCFPNNPEILFSWENSADGSYIHLSEKNSVFHISYDLGMFNYGNYSMEDVIHALKKDGII